MDFKSIEDIPLVGIILLNWKGLDDTRACCESLTKLSYPKARVYVVDNASGDGSAEALSSEYPQFTHVANRENLGFTGGNNAMIHRACAEGCRYVLLLNNDTTVAPDFLDALVSAAEADPKIGMLVGKIYYFSQSEIIWYAGGVVDFEQREPFKHIGENEVDHGQHDLPGETGWITGCCLMVRDEVVRTTGMLDELFGYYCEDVDWCLRARRAGWKILYVPRARIWHRINRSASRANLSHLYYGCRNPLLVARKNIPSLIRWRMYGRAIKWCARFPYGPADNAVLLEATAHGVLGLGGVRANVGKSLWSRTLAFLGQKYKGFKDRLKEILRMKF